MYAPMVEKPNSRNLEQAGEFMQKIVREMQAFIRIVYVLLIVFKTEIRAHNFILFLNINIKKEKKDANGHF